MLVEYINRRGEVNYIRPVKTSKGGVRYYIVRDKSKYNSDDLLKEMPDEFEFYENPEDGKVRFRKKIIPVFKESERAIAENVMEAHKTIDDYIVEIEKDYLKIYEGHIKVGEYGWEKKEDFIKYQSYNEKLRVLKLENKYCMQRYCSWPQKGWITIESSENLKYLCEKFCYHIDKESLYQFWIEGEEDW